MDVNEARRILQNLLQNQNKWQTELLQQLLEGLQNLPENCSGIELSKPIKEIISEYWRNYSPSVIDEVFEQSAEVCSIIDIQQALKGADNFIVELHHPYFFQQYLKKYDSNANLSFMQWQPLLASFCRIVGAKRKEEEDYPFARIRKTAKYPHLQDSLSTMVMGLGILFYIVNTHCTKEQLDLIPLLLHYRKDTMNEERRSEKKFIKQLTHNKSDCLKIFHKYSGFMNGREFNQQLSINSLKSYIPNSTKTLKDALAFDLWKPAINDDEQHDSPYPSEMTHDILYTTRYDSFVVEDDEDEDWAIRLEAACHSESIENLVEFFERDYNAQKKMTVFSYISEKLELLGKPLNKLDELIIPAFFVFCLEKYILARQKETYSSSFFSFSLKTKCDAARKKIEEIKGNPVEWSTLEQLALHQGRLGDLVELFKEETPDRLRF